MNVRQRSRGTLHPRFANSFASLENRGRRECRMRAAPAVSCAKNCTVGAHEHTGSAEAVRHPLRNGFTAYFVLSPVSGLFCHRHWRDIFRQLSASIAAPGPHDFAVRLGVFVRCEKIHLTPKRPSHSDPTHRDDRETPLGWAGMAGVIIPIFRIVKRNIFYSWA